VARVTSRFRQFDRFVKDHLARNLDAAASYASAGIKDDIAIQGPPRSLPGKAPHRDTGDLIAAEWVDTDRRGLRSRLGSDDDAAYWLEVGTARMEPRPFRFEAIVMRRSPLAAILFRPL
jgi:hypothetical protein